MKKRPRIAAVLLAAGKGKRFGPGIPKQFRNVDGKPVLHYVIKKFIDSCVFSEIVVVVNQGWVERTRALVRKLQGDNDKKCSISCIRGGAYRSLSSYNAVKYLDGLDVDYVVFHDAVRPFITLSIINRVVQTAIRYGSAIVGMKILESVAAVEKNQIIHAFPSENLFHLQTPECYKFSTISCAYKQLSSDKEYFRTATNLHLVSRLGEKMVMVRNDDRNLKLTFASDFPMVESFLSEKHG